MHHTRRATPYKPARSEPRTCAHTGRSWQWTDRRLARSGVEIFRSPTGLAKGRSLLGILLGRDRQIGLGTALVVGMQFFEKGHTPAAPGAGTEAFGNQRSHRGILTLDERADLAKRNAEAEADVVVRIHAGSVSPATQARRRRTIPSVATSSRPAVWGPGTSRICPRTSPPGNCVVWKST